jgi:UDP-N-acetylmuramate--alanine ligase
VPGGTVLVNSQDPNAAEVAKAQKLDDRKLEYYSAGAQAFKLKLAGAHNQSNAAAAAKVAGLLGVDEQKIRTSLAEFKGAWRRLEELQPGLFTDYAHHPTEIAATLKGLKESNPGKQLVCVFQPHQRQRLNVLFEEFSQAFSSADQVILIPLYLVRGRDDAEGKGSKELVEHMSHPNVSYATSFDQAFEMARPLFDERHIVVFMGAGDIDENLRQKLAI